MEKRSVEEITAMYPGLFDENNGITKLSRWHAEGPPLLGEPVTEEEIDRRLLAAAEREDTGELKKYLDKVFSSL